MRVSGIDYCYQYQQPSQYIKIKGKKGQLQLCTSGVTAPENPIFFEGTIQNPQRVAALLCGLVSVVQTRFYTPPVMLQRLIALSDPVVTCSDGCLRFEGFSGCCGVYARLDLLSAAVSGTIKARGTTNVDFNKPMVNALSTIRAGDTMGLSIGSDQVQVMRADMQVVEKKVKLPFRWLKSFVEVQAYQSRMHPVIKIPGPEAVRFLRGLPRMKTNRRETWIVQAGRGLRLSQVKPKIPAVRVGGLERLRVLERFVAAANRLTIYADSVSHATGWVLDFGDCRLQLVLSPEVWRGFSGEGQVLSTLHNTLTAAKIRSVQAGLTWSAVLALDELAQKTGVSPEEVEDILALLGTRGLVGYDLEAQSYFHRILPFDLSAVEKMQPRLVAAQKLIGANQVKIASLTDMWVEAFVKSKSVEHCVHLKNNTFDCTCPWYAKHNNNRGPCKHILAVQIYLEEHSK